MHVHIARTLDSFIYIYIYISKKTWKLFLSRMKKLFTSRVVVFSSEPRNNSVFELEKKVTSFKLKYIQLSMA